MAPARGQQGPDRGWAWVVLAASMGSQLLTGALFFSVGILHMGLLDKFHQSHVTFLALISAVFTSLVCLAAPLASCIVNRFSCRTCCVVGGLLCFAGLTASAFVTSVYVLFFTYGITAGLGLGLVYPSSNITIGFHFDRLRGVASGISNSCQAVGILIGPILLQALMGEYGVNGTFLLLGATSLHFCFFGMFFRPTIYEGRTLEINVESTGEIIIPTDIKDNDSICKTAEEKTALKCDTAKTEMRFPLFEQIHEDSRIPLLKQNQEDGIEIHPTPGSPLGSCDAVVDVSCDQSMNADLHTTKGSITHVFVDDANIAAAATSSEEDRICMSGQNTEKDSSDSSAPSFENKNIGNSKHDSNPTVQVDLLDFDSVTSYYAEGGDSVLDSTSEDTLLPRACEEGAGDTSSKSASHDVGKSASNTGLVSPNAHPSGKRWNRMNLLERLRSSPYVTILNKAVLFYCVALFASSVQITGVVLHLPEYARLSGTTPIQIAELFLAVGVFNMVSRLASGFTTADPTVDPLILNIGLMGLNGVITCFFPLYPGSNPFIKQMVFSSLFGLYFGGLFTLVTPTMVRFVGVERLAHAYGLGVFMQGLGMMVGPPVAAIIIENGGTYDQSFIVLGCMMLSGAFFDMGAACFMGPDKSRREDKPSSLDGGYSVKDIIHSTASLRM